MRNMKKLFVATLIAATLASSAAFAMSPWPETLRQPFQATSGTVDRIDPDGRSVTLVNGPTFTVSPSLSVEPLQPGEDVTIAYHEQDGQKEMTGFWIDALPRAGH
jgi:hypothetical protein